MNTSLELYMYQVLKSIASGKTIEKTYEGKMKLETWTPKTATKAGLIKQAEKALEILDHIGMEEEG